MVDISGGELPGQMNIDRFEVTRKGEQYLAVYSVSDCEDQLDFAIYADTDQSGYDGERVADFYGDASGEYEFTLDSCDSGFYYFYVKVSDSHGLFNFQYADQAVEYVNPYREHELNNLSIQLLNTDIYVSCDDFDYEGMKIWIYDSSNHELLQEEVVNDSSYITSLPSGYSEVIVGVAPYDHEEAGKVVYQKLRKADFSDAAISFQREEYWNSLTLPVEIQFSNEYLVYVIVDDEMVIKDETEAKTYAVPVHEGDNTVIVLLKDAQGNINTEEKQIYVDVTAPQLSVNEDLDGKITKESFIYVQGYSEAGAIVTCNGTEMSFYSSRKFANIVRIKRRR